MYQVKQIYSRSEVGRRIRSRRKELGLSRQEIAEQIGKAEKYYADIERGYCGMSLDTMIDIAGCLGVTLDYLVFGEEDGNELAEDSRALLFYLNSCEDRKRRKAVELLRVYLSE